jgi:hypothetical protein
MAYIYYVTHIQFDHGAISTLKAECERVGIQCPMIVTDKGVRGAGIVDLERSPQRFLMMCPATRQRLPYKPVCSPTAQESATD